MNTKISIENIIYKCLNIRYEINLIEATHSENIVSNSLLNLHHPEGKNMKTILQEP